MGLRARAVLVWGLYVLCLASGARGTQNEDVYPEEGHQVESLQSPSMVPTTVKNEDCRVTGRVQYKTAEIADAMESSDVQPDPAVLLSMLPRVMKDRDGVDGVCDTAMGDAECGSRDSTLNNPGDQAKNMDPNVADTEQARTDDANATDSSKPLKVNCEDRNITNIENFTLQILNISQDLMDFLNPNSSECTMVLFFTPWCQFSAALAPHFNALPRAFPTLQFLALDASQHSSLSTRFGTVAVPNILLFQGAKPMARFNHSDRNLESFKSFLFNQSGIEAKPDIFVTEADLEGPLPSTPQAGIDWLLVFSVVYVTSFIVYATMQTDRIRWLIPGQEQEHQD
ncbi:thioredoxin domain-containing protein 15 isoform X1 [Bufo gargarizans]|uniref:thioredoxin domain-containing protein 15 isoform X1 n=2 Tax=Bufo gargarizans TaxID=30331 RepID=UPI001CF4E1C7|nr:thioredoxin domain-containing protein 15 isoform X1 [Bufo gargarizans]